MIIGVIVWSREMILENENEDFQVLREQRDLVRKEFGLGEERLLELSMGMSEDFEGVIVMGSDEVRVGSMIFGVRGLKSEVVVVVVQGEGV